MCLSILWGLALKGLKLVLMAFLLNPFFLILSLIRHLITFTFSIMFELSLFSSFSIMVELLFYLSALKFLQFQVSLSSLDCCSVSVFSSFFNASRNDCNESLTFLLSENLKFKYPCESEKQNFTFQLVFFNT